MSSRSLATFAAIVLPAVSAGAQQSQQSHQTQQTRTLESELTVDRIFKTGEFRAANLPETHWLKDGVSFIDAGAADGVAGSEIIRTDALTGKTTVLVPASALVGADGKPLQVEDMTLSDDQTKALLFHDSERVWRANTKGQWTVVDFATRKLTPIAPNTAAKMFAKFSPDNRRVAYVRNNNLFVWDLASGTERQLTTDGSANIINGTTDWAYEEELDLRDAFRWSPDGAHIAFLRLDQAQVPTMTLINQTDSLYPILEQYKYPKAGEPNSKARIGVVSVGGGATRWIDTGTDSLVYLPRLDWVGTDSIWVERIPRRQNRAELLMASIATGGTRPILTDSDSAYVDVIDPVWVNTNRQLLILSDRSGWRQLYLYDRDGKLVRQITKDGADVTSVLGSDDRTGSVYVREAAPAPAQSQIYRYTLDGKSGGRITTQAGSYNMSLAPGGRYAAVTRSTLTMPPTMTLNELPSMRQVRVIADNSRLTAKLVGLRIAQPQFIRIPAADGRTMLDAYRIVPADFDSNKKYPVLMYTYGGPANPQVTDSWAGSRWLFHQMLAQHGYIIAVVDNRGAAWRGRDFRKMTQYHLGLAESDDQIAVAKWIGQQPWGDAKRVGIWGWSYGGYNTAMSAFRGGSVFRMAMSVAPVTDWRFYDSIYTE
ncbi:MAG: S9 family peptidase, partial [Gemmatimonadaceae bacterium]